MTQHSAPEQAFKTIFESVPGLYLVLTPAFEIVEASNAYLKATMTTRDIIGKNIFDVFPDNPEDPKATGAGNLRASLEMVLESRVADTMAIQKYDIRRPESQGGEFEVRYWRPLNSPVLDSRGNVTYIIHHAEDVTDFVKLQQRKARQINDVERVAEQPFRQIWLPITLCLVIWVADISLPAGIAAGVLYIPFICCSIWHRQSGMPFIFACIATILATASYLFKPASQVDLWVELINRGFTLSSLWLVAVLIYLGKRSEISLHETLERQNLVMRGLSVGILDWNIPTGELYWSAKFKEILGVQDKELLPHYNEFTSRLHPEDRARTLKAISNHLNKQEPYDVEFRLKHADGNYVWIHAKGQAQWDKYGRPQRMVGSADDITWRKQAQIRQERNSAYLEAITNTIIDGLITINARGIIKSFNPAAEKLFGYKAKEVIGKNVKLLMPEPYHGEHDRYLSNYMHTGNAKVIGIGREVTGQRKDGSIFPVELGVNEMRIGKSVIFVGTIRDISERKEAERERREYMQKLEHSNKDLDAFVYVASHDLKSPLRAIDNLSKWLSEDLPNLNAENQERLKKMQGRVRRMERLLDDILEYSRAGRKTDKSPPIDAAMLVAEISEMLDVPEGFEIIADPSLEGIMIPRMPLQQVFHNLVSNSIKHHDRKQGTVRIAVYREGAEFHFTVGDDGPGIPPEYHERVFEMFQTLRPRDEVEGSGMGLALVRKIINRAGGVVTLKSGAGRGAIFSFTWPLTDSQTMREAA